MLRALWRFGCRHVRALHQEPHVPVGAGGVGQLCGLLLHPRNGVHVDILGEGNCGMPQPLRHDFRRHAGSQPEGGVGVAEVM